MGRPTCTRIPMTLAAAAALLTAACVSHPLRAEPPKGRPKHTNRLAQETSPYLRQHAHNPVGWHPWGTEAFAKAKKEKKLVFLSVGYSSCYWCHVMERESFENEAVAKLLNDWFVCIKVDREERPDVDQIYMNALQVYYQLSDVESGGGWPMSMFLTPDGKPIIGGTYWPPEDREIEGKKVRGFKSILKLVHDVYQKSPQDVEEQADKIASATKDVLARAARGVALVDLDRSLVDGAVEALKDEYDPQHGGFGARTRRFRGPKFPVPPYLDLLLLEAGRTKSEELTDMLTKTLDGMAQGGIYDQLGGGFHRYSTERTWTVPHFEKMLYDNAQLVEVYSRAYTLTKKPLYRRIVDETLAFVAREMTSPEGGFYSALDAETVAEEGRFYVWTAKELNAVLTGEADAGLFKKTYGLDGPPNFESKYYILVLAQPQAETEARLAPLRKKLLDTRDKRPRPFLDTKILTAWSGQMIAGYAIAGKELREPQYTATAVRAAEFILKQLRAKEGRLLRSYAAQPGKAAEARLNAYLDDYAYLVHGLLCLHDTTGDKKWLEEAKTLTDAMVQHFGDKDRGGFFYTSHDHEKLFARAKDQHDGAQPSGNSQAARNLVRLATKTGDARYRELAEKTIKAFSVPLKSAPTSVTTLAAALDLHLAAATGNAPAKPKDSGDKAPTKSDSVVTMMVKAAPDKPGADGKQVLTITLAMEKGWHVYANPVGNEQFESAQTTVAVAGKAKPESVKIEYPEGKLVKDKLAGDYNIYEDKITIKATVQRAKGDSGPLEVSIRLMSCNSKGVCLLPATVKVKVPADK